MMASAPEELPEGFDAKLSQLISMGYEADMAENALEASGGDLERAIEMLLAGNFESCSTDAPVTSRGEAESSRSGGISSFLSTMEGKTTKEVLDIWGKQLLGEGKHTQVRGHVKKGCMATKQAWIKTVDKVREIDEKKQISARTKETVQKYDEKVKKFDEKHQWSSKTAQAAEVASREFNKTVEYAKRSFVQTNTGSTQPNTESRQDMMMS